MQARPGVGSFGPKYFSVGRCCRFVAGIGEVLPQVLFSDEVWNYERRLRLKEVDFDRKVSVVREAKGGKDRVVMLPRFV